jgi:uncharacterized protein YndB with AHSA1/START domain
MPAKGKTERTSERELVTTHILDAPRELVWKAWTDSKLIPRWWGPRYLTTIVDKMDFRPGGAWRFVHHDAEGKEYAFHGVYREIVALEKIVDTFEFEGMPGHVLVETAVFEDLGGKTKVTQKSVFETVEDLEGMLASGMEEGARETMERFTELVEEMKKGTATRPKKEQAKGRARKNELVITRIFDAPRERVWKAWTDPGEARQWWGPKGFTTPSLSVDLRVGGIFRYCMRSPEGKDYWGTGVYREIVPGKRIVYTDSFADEKGNVVPATYYGMGADIPLEMLVTVSFEEENGQTKVTLRHAGMPVGPHRDGAMQGWNEMFDKLVEHLGG